MQNVECKCSLNDPKLARLAARKVGALRVGEVEQFDTFYKLAEGRLMRRETPGERVTYIHYHRIDRSIPKLSHYLIYNERQAKTRFGTASLVPWVTVAKTREIWLYRNAHIHIDEVRSLGTYLEIEALVTPTNHVGHAHRLIGEIRKKLGPALGELISTSYADLTALDMEAAAS
jgi:predicted adenylyl cyclase CyaB